MKEIIKELRSVLEMQHAIQGTLVPLGSSEDTLFEKTPITDSIHTPTTKPASLRESNPPHSTDTMPNSDLFGNEVDPANDINLSPYERIGGLIPAESPLHTLHSLDAVATYVATNILIPLDEQRINPVFGVGNPESNLLVIGEAPGADEDKKGEPFVGRAGQLLDKILTAINFERNDIYIANILKSRPPNNRDPHPDEIAAHIPILYKQIALIKPKIILCVGKTAGNTLLNKKGSLASLRGKFNDFYGVPVMVTYHPAALLRNPHWKRPTWEDVQLLRTHYDELVG